MLPKIPIHLYPPPAVACRVSDTHSECSVFSNHRKKTIFFILSFLIFSFLFTSCDFWNEPVHDYFEKWTSEVSIAKYELVGIESYTDKDGNLCIASDQDAPVKLFMINPYHYTNVVIASDDIETSATGTFPTITQNVDDSTLLDFTYGSDFLLSNECGGDIGATINVRHPMNGTAKEYTFSLKCNSRPPEVKGQAVLVSASLGQKYVICFYLPTSELSSDRHINDIHTIFIDDTAIATGTVAQLTEASVDRPSDLTRLSRGALFDSAPPSGYTPFYYVTNRIMQENDNFSWDIRLEDDDGLCSRTMKASTIVTEAHMSVSGGDEIVITTNEGSKTATISAEVDEGIVQSWTWTSNEEDIATVTADANNGSQATITGVSGGMTTISIQAELVDGRVVRSTKTIRVLAISLGEEDSMIVNGDSGALSITPVPTAFTTTPSYTWNSNNTEVATVDSNGNVTAVAHGTAVITASASYGDKLVISSGKTINVYEVSAIQGDNVGFVGTGNEFNVGVQVTAPDGSPVSSFDQTWSSSNTSVAPAPSGIDTTARTVSPTANGSTIISVEVTVAGKKATRQKTLTIYDLVVSGNKLLSQTGTTNSLTLTPSLKSGNTTYNESVTYSYNAGTETNATVSNYGVVTAKNTGNGSEDITVTATVNGKTLTKTHTVHVIAVSGNTNFIAGETARPLTATTKPTGYSYNWSSSNSNKTQVNSSTGMITAITEGSTTITLTVTKLGGSESLAITTPITTYSLSIIGNTLYDKTDSAKIFTPSLKNGNIDYPESDITYSWTSGTTANATIDETTGILTPKAGGSTLITLSAKRDGVTVKSVTKTIYVIGIIGCTNFIAGETERALTVADGNSGATLTWGTNDSDKVSVNASSGKINAISNGTATIKLTATKGTESLTVSTQITIYTLSIVGNTLYDKTAGAKTFTPSLKNGNTAYPDSDISYSWSSGTAATATIGSTTGSMTPKAGGSTVISLTAKRNGTTVKTVTKTIYVIEVKGCTNFIVGGSARALTVVPASISGVNYTWSTNSSLATVNQSTGNITASSSGNLKIYLRATNGSETINVETNITNSNLSLSSPMTVISGTTINIAVGEEFSVTKALSPNFTYSSMTCTSSNSNIAAVDNNFKITGKAQGSSSITVSFTMSDNTVLTKENAFTVNVLQYHTVSSKDALNSFLSNMPANTNGTPYKIKITNLTSSDVYQGPDATYAVEGTLRKILQTNSTKYVDLSEVTLPVVEDMSYLFHQCSTLVKPPRIPNGVTNLSYAFNSCSNLKTAPSIPSGVTSLFCTFYDCENLETAPSSIPSTVTYMVRTFSGCRKLQSVPTIPEGIINMNYCFYDCDSLNQDMILPSTLEELVSVFQSSGLNGKTIKVKADFYGVNGAGTDKWENAFAGVASVNVWVASQEAGDACSNAPGWNEATMEIVGILP